jgi:hypothetical protein
MEAGRHGGIACTKIPVHFAGVDAMMLGGEADCGTGSSTSRPASVVLGVGMPCARALHLALSRSQLLHGGEARNVNGRLADGGGVQLLLGSYDGGLLVGHGACRMLNRDRASYSACRIGPLVSHWFQSCDADHQPGMFDALDGLLQLRSKGYLPGRAEADHIPESLMPGQKAPLPPAPN